MKNTINHLKVNNIKQSFFINRALFGFLVGLGFSWFLFLMFRCFWDGQNPFLLSEFWILVVLNLSIIYLWPSLKPKQTISKPINQSKLIHKNMYEDYICEPDNKLKVQSFKNKLGEIIIVSLFALVGAGFVFSWHLQNMQKNIDFKVLMEQSEFISSSSIISSMINENNLNCSSATFFINEAILNNTSWKMSVFEKLWVKEKILSIHDNDCLSDSDLFNIIRNLSTRPTKEGIKMSSVASWTFDSSINNNFKKDIPITRSQWCFHQNKNKTTNQDGLIKTCNGLPFSNQVILRPEFIEI